MSSPYVEVIGEANGSTGWATHSLEYARALRSLTSVSFRTTRRDAMKRILSRDGEMMLRGLLDRRSRDFSVVVTGQPRRRKSSSRWVVWETTELPERQRDACEAVEYLWTPSTWGRANLLANGFAAERIAIVPEGVDTRFFTPAEERGSGRPFRFLMVGKWEERKFPEGLLRAFTKEFKPSEPVELYLHAHNSYLPGFSLAQAVAATASNDHAIVLGAPCDKAALRSLYRSADCFVLPTRAEGWGLPILESMSCGVPAIVTRYSAPLDYVDDSNGYLIDVQRLVEAHDPVFDIHTGLWAEPDEHHLAHLMRQAFRETGERMAKGAQARNSAMAFTWRNAARTSLEAISGHLGA